MTFPASLPFPSPRIFLPSLHSIVSVQTHARTQSDRANQHARPAVAQEESRGGARAKRNDVAVMETGGSGERRTEEEAARWAYGAVAALGLAGAGVLVWWAVAFHPAHEQLWMVPVGLVLLGTPLVTWLSLFASGACRRLGRLRAAADQPHLAPDK